MDEARSELLAEVAEVRKMADELASSLQSLILYTEGTCRIHGWGYGFLSRQREVLAKYKSMRAE